MFVPALAFVVALNQTPTEITAPKTQQFGELIIQTDIEFKAQPEQSNFRAWVAEVKESGSVTQVASIVETNLTKLETKLTPQQICDLHDRASRTRQGFSAQLFKTEQTKINNRPMVLLIGSTLTRDVAQKPINTYHVSAALSTETKAYEITWITYRGGEDFTNAVKTVRSVELKSEEQTYKPEYLFGTIGKYSLLGAPFQFILNKPTAASTEARPATGQSGRYIGSLSEGEWYATVEIAQYAADITKTEPAELLEALGYGAWLKNQTPAPTPKLVEGVNVFENIAISEARHARIEIGVSGKFICAVIVSAAKDSPLPDRSVISMLP